jgi:hypothetical protein
MMIKVGNLRAHKTEYVNGVRCCILYPLGYDDKGSGICFDFAFDDIGNLIEIMTLLKDAPIDERIDAEGNIIDG